MRCTYRNRGYRCAIHTADHVLPDHHYMVKSVRARYPILTAIAVTYVGLLSVIAVTIGTIVAVKV